MTVLNSEQTDTRAHEDDGDIAVVAAVEADIRKIVHTDIAYLHRATPTLAHVATAEASASHVNSLIQRVSGQSLADIDNLLAELEDLRGFLHGEGERVQREIARFAELSQSAKKSTRMIADTMSQWKSSLPNLPRD